jgi:hypothetical protein
MDKKELKTVEEVVERAKEAIDVPYSEVEKLAAKYQQELGVNAHTGKGDIGQTYEEGWFNYVCNNESKPDFEEADVELKVTPYLKNSKGYRAKERLTLGMIGYKTENFEDFYESHFWRKNHRLLIMYYFYSQRLNKKDYAIKKLDLLELDKLPKRDFEIIKHDWQKIAFAVSNGKAHELTERDFTYLSPCTKGSGGQKPVLYNIAYPAAKKRAYSFKNSYMTVLFNQRMLSEEKGSSVIENVDLLRNTFFDDILLKIIEPYLGRTQKSLIEEFGIPKQGYNVNSVIVKKIFKCSCELDETDEFKKADYKLRTVTVNDKGMPKEDMPFGNFCFNEILREKSWKNSQVFEEMVAPKFLFVIFSLNKKGELELNNCMIWYLPNKDIKKLRTVWEKTRQVLSDGIILNQSTKHNKKGELIYCYKSNFPKASKFEVAHVRNKAKEVEYFEKNKHSDILPKPAHIIFVDEVPYELIEAPLPTGRVMTKQCFWFNKKYIKKQIEAHIIK